MISENDRFFIGRINRSLLFLSLFVVLFTFLGAHFAGTYLMDGQDFVLGRDFLNFWHYGIAAWRSDAVHFYNPAFYNAMLGRLFPSHHYWTQLWSYPPHLMLLAAPFGLLGYYWALAAFTLAGVALYWKMVVSSFTERQQRFALIAMPTFTVFLVCGQLSAFLAVALVAIYRLLDRRPLIAGLLIALLTVKPQIGLLIPVFLILTRRWKVFAIAAAGTLFLVGLSIAVHGLEIWRVYLKYGIALQWEIVLHSNPWVLGLMPTTLADMILLGAGRPMAMIVQAVVSVVAVVLMWRVIAVTEDRFLQFAALIAATVVATPYLMSYDTLVLGWVMMNLAQRHEMSRFQRAMYQLVMIICPLGIVLSVLSIPGTPLILMGLLVWVWQSAMVDKKIAATPGAATSVTTRL